jgi:hypothetical protein
VGRLLSINGAAHLGTVWERRQVTLRGDAAEGLTLPLRPQPFIVQLAISRTVNGLGVLPTFTVG